MPFIQDMELTELLSQAYSKGNGIFNCPPWMKVLVRDDEDPLSVYSSQPVVQSQSASKNPGFKNVLPAPDSRLPTLNGAINIIDLANIYSCSFIATDDVGRLHADGSFKFGPFGWE